MPKAAIEVPDQGLLLQHFRYDPETGALFRACGSETTRRANSSGYRIASFMGRSYLVHRLIWQMVYADVNGRQVDHTNGDKSDNRLSNLRSASDQTNCWNKGVRKGKAVPFKGVVVDHRNGRFKAYITVRGHRSYLGSFTDAESAADAYRKAAISKFGFFANDGKFGSKSDRVAAVAQSFQDWRGGRV